MHPKIYTCVKKNFFFICVEIWGQMKRLTGEDQGVDRPSCHAVNLDKPCGLPCILPHKKRWFSKAFPFGSICPTLENSLTPKLIFQISIKHRSVWQQFPEAASHFGWKWLTFVQKTLIIKAVYAIDAGTLMIASQKKEVLWVLHFVRQEEANGLQRLSVPESRWQEVTVDIWATTDRQGDWETAFEHIFQQMPHPAVLQCQPCGEPKFIMLFRMLPDIWRSFSYLLHPEVPPWPECQEP